MGWSNPRGRSGGRAKALAAAVALAVLAGPLSAGPAWAQGAAATRHPETRFDGTWNKDGSSLKYAPNPPMKPEAAARVAAMRPQDEPGARCVEAGLGRFMIGPSPMQIVALDNHILMVTEFYHSVRRIWTDRKTHDPDADVGYYGDSIVSWDGDTMVVDTVGLNGKNFLDSFGTPYSTDMHVVERWRLLNPDKLEVQFTFDDPRNYTQPWGATLTYSRKSDWRLGEYSCTENNRNDPTNASLPKGWTSTDKPFVRVLTGQDILFGKKDAPK